MKKLYNKEFTQNMTQTIKNAVGKALLHHYAAGNKIAFWHKGKVAIQSEREILKNKKHS